MEHFAYFGRRKSAEAAAADLNTAGFRTELNRSGLRTVVIARHDSDVRAETVGATTDLLFALVEGHGGRYDGWGGTIVPA